MCRTSLLVPLLCLPACYQPPAAQLTADTEGGGSSGTSPSTLSDSGGEGSTTGRRDSSPTGPDDATSSNGDGTDSASGDSTGAAQLGPQLVMSTPSDGDTQAPLAPYFALYFDRVVNPNDAVGRILVSQNGSDPQPISPMGCPPDSDPTCIFGIFPASFHEGESNRLPGATEHTIVIQAAFADPDGVANTVDQTVHFTTFGYDPEFFDDSVAISDDLGGLAYDVGTESLFVVGGSQGCVLRRVPLAGGIPGAATTAALPTQSSLCYGLDAFDDLLFVSGSYSNNVYRYRGLEAEDLQGGESIIANPTLPAPLNNLDEVWSVARGANSLFFAHGEFFGGVEDSSILRQTSDGTWSEFQSGVNLWNDAGGVQLAHGTIDGVDVLFVGAEETLYKFRAADGALVSSAEAPGLRGSFDLQVDSQNRVWVGSSGGLRVWDGVSDTYELLAERAGLDASRFALREEGRVVHAYYSRFQDEGRIGHLAVEF